MKDGVGGGWRVASPPLTAAAAIVQALAMQAPGGAVAVRLGTAPAAPARVLDVRV